MKTIGQVGKQQRQLFGWKDGDTFYLSVMDRTWMANGAAYRPAKAFTSKEAAEAEAVARNSVIEWQ